MVDIFLGPVHFVSGIFGEDILPHRALKSFADDCVVMDHGICRATIRQDFLIEVLNVLGRQIHHRNSTWLKVRDDAGPEHIGITLVRSGCDGRTHTVQPLVHIGREFQPRIGRNCLGQNAFLFLSLQLFLVLFLELASNFIECSFCLTLAGSIYRQFGRDPFYFSLSVNFEV